MTFLDGSTVVAANVLATNGVATWKTTTLALGSHGITAKFDGSTSFNASTSNMVTHVVSTSGTAPGGEDGGTSVITPDGGAGAPGADDPGVGGRVDGGAIDAPSLGGGGGACGCATVGTDLVGGIGGLGAGLALAVGLVVRRRRRRAA